MRRLLTAAARHAGPGWVVLRRAGARRGRGDNASGSEASASARGANGEHGQQHAVGADPAGEGGSRAAAAPALGHCSLGTASLWGRRGGAGQMLRDRTEGHRASVPRTGVAGFGRVRRTKGNEVRSAANARSARVAHDAPSDSHARTGCQRGAGEGDGGGEEVAWGCMPRGVKGVDARVAERGMSCEATGGWSGSPLRPNTRSGCCHRQRG